MARYIDADLLIKIIAKTQDLRTLSTKTIGEAISRTPTADVVEKAEYEAVIAGQKTLQKHLATVKKEKAALTFGNKSLRWCLIAVKKTLLQIRAIAESYDFDDDVFIAAGANKAINAIDAILDVKEGE